MLRFARPLALAALSLAALAGCGGVYQPARSAGFELDGAAQIDDADIQKAFDARPQLPAAIRVAYYSFDPEVAADLEAALAKVPGVQSVYRIPALMVNGQRRIDEGNSWHPPREVTVKKLRLFAARARADALVVVDHGYKTGGANGLAALNVLLVPALFTPWMDNTVEGYAEAYLIDVRNGYLYGHVTEDDKRGERFASIYARSARAVAKEQWAALEKSLVADLGRVVSREWAAAQKGKIARQ